MEYKIEKGDEVEIDVTIPWSDAEVEFDKLMDASVKNVSVNYVLSTIIHSIHYIIEKHTFGICQTLQKVRPQTTWFTLTVLRDMTISG